MDFRRLLPRLIAIFTVAILLGACTTTEQNGVEQTSDVVDHDAPSSDDASTTDPPPDCETWESEPAGILLTWQRDPTSTMTIDWHVDHDDGDVGDSLCVRPSGADDWDAELEAQAHDVPFLDRTLYRIELTDLDADTEYVFQTGHFEREYRFRTMPEDIDDEPLVFVTGGDTMHAPNMFEKTNRVAIDYDPAFIAWGGDFAYADGGDDPLHDERWEWWFETVADTLVDDDGRVVPILVSIGNHEVVDGYIDEHDDYEPTDEFRADIAPYFYSFFAFPGQPGYGVLDFADYLTLISLDTDHTNPVEGEQTDWLEDVLTQRQQAGVNHVIPFYHVAAFPSYRDFDGDIQTRIRDHWVPLFEDHGVRTVFENHDHTYKRTHPVRDGEIDEDDGIVYIGDGAWGVVTRSGESEDEWYIDRFERERHIIVVTLQGDDEHVLIVSEEGEVLDEYGDDL